MLNFFQFCVENICIYVEIFYTFANVKQNKQV